MSRADYTFKDGGCITCDQQPTLKDTGMCAVCTFGEADSMWEWLDDGVVLAEPHNAQDWLAGEFKTLRKAGMIDKKGNIDPMAAMLMHINQHVVDRIEAIL